MAVGLKAVLVVVVVVIVLIVAVAVALIVVFEPLVLAGVRRAEHIPNLATARSELGFYLFNGLVIIHVSLAKGPAV